MPNLLYGIAGAGGGAIGAQKYQQGKQAIQANELALERARRELAEDEAKKEREEGFRKGMSQAIGAIGKMQALNESRPRRPEPLTPEDVGSAAQTGFAKSGPMGAFAGAAGAVGEHQSKLQQVQDWLKGKDDQTAQVVGRINRIASKLAETDPKAALWLYEQSRTQLHGRVMQAAVESFTKRGASLIQHVTQLGASGRLTPELAEEFAGRLQQAMELAESQPDQLGVAEQAYNSAFDALKGELKEQDRRTVAATELDWYASKPGGFDRSVLDEAKRLLELGVDPDEVMGFVRGTQNAWTGGFLKDAPHRMKQEWKAQAWDETLKFLGDAVPRDETKDETDEQYIERLMTMARQYLPDFLTAIHQRNGVIDAGARELPQGLPSTPWAAGMYDPQGQAPAAQRQQPQAPQAAPEPSAPAGPVQAPAASGAGRPTSEIPMATDFRTQPQGGPPVGPGMQPIDPSALNGALQGGEAAEPKIKNKRLARLKKRDDEDPRKFMERVVNEVRKVGGTREDVLDVLEANGIDPSQLKTKPDTKVPFIGKQ